MRERELYAPIKAHFEAQGYEVKGEVGAADVMARRGAEPAVIIELKLAFSLTVFHQALERLKLVDDVYIAVLRPEGKAGIEAVEGQCDALPAAGPWAFDGAAARSYSLSSTARRAPTAPRKNPAQSQEGSSRPFDRLEGDPNEGGATRHGLVTGYRQDALKCATYLAHTGPEKGAIVAKATGVPSATRLMRNNVYGWFEKVETGVYALTPAGRKGLEDWS